ncbi:MAG TPA: aspartate--tRNA(Asn) ligase [Candidatus Saccharimonadia bacterium]|jgi:nondiscriminating aspartyl-tRNA synthetase|nr:aspartate--tRNA(Asn) ligase [Candidatus Saccharimonadia bacterium]
MSNVLVRELPKLAGKTATVRGWLHKRRDLGGMVFVVLRDRSGLIQAVVKDAKEQAKLDGLQNGTVLKITGNVTEEPRATGGVELHEPELEVITPVTEVMPIEIDKPIDHNSENFDTLFEYRALSLRNPQEQKVFRVRAALTRYIREFLTEHEFVEIQTPKLVAGSAEGGAEVFKLDYFGQEATLAQSPQLYKQMMVGVFERVFEIGPAFRAEPSVTTRHMSEVTMLDIEFGFIEGHDDVLNMVQDMTYNVLTQAYKEQGEALEDIKAPKLVLKPKYPRYSMAEIHEMYQKATGKDMSNEVDLTPDEERWICEYAREHDGCEAVFATGLPVSKMKFYHMASDDGKTARSADLLFRGVEIATCPQREHRYEKLVEQMKKSGVDIDSPGFKYFLQAMKFGLPPHGGCGFGVDRLTELVCGLGNVKEATLFPRDTKRLAP